MRFQIIKGSPLFDALQDLRRRGELCSDKAEAFVVRHFGKPFRYANKETELCGGFVAVYRDTKPKPKPKLWRPIVGYPGWYLPFHTAIKNEVERLPVLTHQEVNEVFGLKRFDRKRSPLLIFDTDYVLAAFPDDVRGYEAPEGMVEVLGSVFNDLADKAKKPVE